jgi:hypothetical protein
VALLLLVPSLADAGLWYYGWRCSGQCAPNQLAITGIEGPFATADDCESARFRDGRKDTFIGPGNLGGLDNCEDRDPATNAQVSHGWLPWQRLRFGVVGGYGWHVLDTMGHDSRGDGTVGFDLALVLGAHTNYGFEFGVGGEHVSVIAPFYGAGAKSMFLYPWRMGLTSSPALWHDKLRLDLAADLLWLYRSCSGCNDSVADGYGASIRAGIDYYVGANTGLGITAVFMWAMMGDTGDPVQPTPVQIVAPSVLYQISFTVRNSILAW